jgi:hypothetical protein
MPAARRAVVRASLTGEEVTEATADAWLAAWERERPVHPG